VRVELRRHSVAAVVLDAGECSGGPSRAPRRSLVEGSLAAVVLGTHSSRRGLVGAALFTLAIALHAGAGLAALTSQSKKSTSDQPISRRPSLQIEHVVELAPPEPPEPPAPPPAPPAQARAVERAPSPEAPAPPSEAPPPVAEAGQVVAADESASQPLDFTGFDISTGDGQHFPGGVTASPGKNPRAVPAAAVGRHGEPQGLASASRARPVGLPRRDWDCPWPARATALSIREQFVVIRAVVRADGVVASAELISDPGYGFGEIALACARQQRFPPATGDDGHPITATSPPIRIKFTRP
jgi:protein TonB